MGGLGNQMFQYAYGRHLSVKFNKPLFLEKSFFDNQQGNGVIRSFELDKFPGVKLDTVSNINGNLYQINEGQYVEDVSISDSYLLNGYWQSERFFKESESILRNDFKPSVETLMKISSPILKTNTVSLHVRRTDFSKTNGFHPIQTIDYYNKAITAIGNYDNLLIFSDDINWCKENFSYQNMIFVEGLDDVEDMWLMSMCKKNIIANSSFSWWAAWLNNNPNKRIVAPLQWFGGENNKNASEIIPKNWIKI